MTALTGALFDPTATQIGGLNTLIGIGANAVYTNADQTLAGQSPYIARIGAQTTPLIAQAPDAAGQPLTFQFNTNNVLPVQPDAQMPGGGYNRTGKVVRPGEGILAVGATSTADTTPPVVAVTFPANAATVNGIVTLTASATDDSDPGGVVGVRFWIDGVATGPEDTVGPPWTYDWNTTSVSNASHTIQARARDWSNNATLSTAVTVTVNNNTFSPADLFLDGSEGCFFDFTDATTLWSNQGRSSPAAVAGLINGVTDRSGRNHHLISNTAAGITRQQDATGNYVNCDGTQSPGLFVQGNAMPVGNAAGFTVAVAGQVGSTATRMTFIASDYSAIAQRVSEGISYNAAGGGIYSTAWDGANTTSSLGAGTLAAAEDAAMVAVCNPQPAAFLEIRKNGASLALSSVVNKTPKATATTSIGIGASFNFGGSNASNKLTGRIYACVWINRLLTTNELAQLEAWLAVKARKDTIPPAVSITAPASGATVSGSTVTVSASASDNVGVVGVQFKLDGTNLGAEDLASPYSITWDSTTATNGAHNLSATARDAAGNTATATVPVTVANGVAGTNIIIGGNLPIVTEYMPDEMFSDLIFHCRGFGTPADPYSGVVAVDANGWPTAASSTVLPRTPDNPATQDFNFSVDGDNRDFTLNPAYGWTINGLNYDGTRTTAVLRQPAGARSGLQPVLVLARAAQNIRVMRPGLASDGSQSIINPGYVTYANGVGFAWVRSMDWEVINHDVSTTPFTECTPPATNTRRTNRGGKLHVGFGALMAAAMAKKGLWTCCKIAADDAYMNAKATWCRDNIPTNVEQKWELSNEVWNQSFAQFGYVVAQVCIEVDGWHAQNVSSNTRRIVSITRAAGTLTIETLSAHGYTAGLTLYCQSIGNLSKGAHNVGTVVDSTHFSLADTDTGSDGPISLSGLNASVMRLINTDLNGYDGAIDVVSSLHPRWITRRAAQMSVILRQVFGDGAMMTRVNPVLMAQTVNSMSQHLGYYLARLASQPLGYYFRAIGAGWYMDLKGTAYVVPGMTQPADMRNLNTYNGNTPPSIGDYQANEAYQARAAKIGNLHDTYAINAKKYGVEVWKYEVGPDLNSNPLGSTNATTNNQKLASLFDPAYKAIAKDFIAEQQRFGVQQIGWYSMGAVTIDSTSENVWWPIINDLATYATESRVQAIQEVLAAAHPGLARNKVTAVGTTNVDLRGKAGVFPDDWPAGNTYSGAFLINFTGPLPDSDVGDPRDPKGDFTGSNVTLAWNWTFDAAATKTFSFGTATNGSGTRKFDIYWNNQKVGGTITVTGGQTQAWTVSVPAVAGTNVLEFVPNGFCGTYVSILNPASFS